MALCATKRDESLAATQLSHSLFDAGTRGRAGPITNRPQDAILPHKTCAA
jgi:hypothetical protein